MEKRFQVKRFLFETTTDDAVCWFMLTDRILSMLATNQYIKMKNVNKFGTGKAGDEATFLFQGASNRIGGKRGKISER